MAAEPTPSGAGPRDETAGPTQPGAPPHTGAPPVLLDGSAEGRLLPRLIDRLGDPDLDRIAMAVSFVMKSGLTRVLHPL